MNLNREIVFKSIFLFLICISYFAGYFLRENAAGGGAEFFHMEWLTIQSLKKDFLYTIKNYGEFRDYTMPFPYIASAFLNPFSDNATNFQLSNTMISFSVFLILSIVTKKVFFSIKYIDALLISSALLILPFFRTSAFWGKLDNLGWLFLIIAFYFFNEIKKNIKLEPTNKDLLNVIFFCLASAFALYARQALFFLPISYLLYLYFYKANKKIIITSIISFAIFSIPGFLLMWTWGSVFHAVPGIEPWGSFFGGWINYNHVLKNMPILFSYFGFYLLPILIIEFFNTGYKSFNQTYAKNFLIVLVFLIILQQLNLLSYLGNYSLGGGAVLKFNYLIKNNNFLLLLIFAAIGASALIRFFKEDIKNNLTLLLPLIIVYGFPRLLYQEYVEPLILVIFFLGIKTSLHKIYFKNISFSHFISLLYFALFLAGSVYYKHFIFSS